jgi:hypothetical protein
MADTEEVDALPVLADEAAVVWPYPSGGELTGGRRQASAVIPAVQAVAVAAGGFVAGVAVVGLATRRRRHAPTLARGRRAGRRLARGRKDAGGPLGELVQIVGSRSLLVDVHLLGSGGER